MINYCVKHKEIDLYVEHEINTIVFVDDDLTLAVACLQFGGDGNKSGEGGVVVGSKCGEGEGEGEGREVVGKNGGKDEGEGKSGEVADSIGEEGDDVAVSECGESDGRG
ncbi:hypothetical protein Golax_018035 [Gossypium laxum]|uniref:Uncharacterized protein n=1 Tax=Gossypium laxum TaxID=34288 RepID=A0A7J8Z266_9ROSI|nr:hypothetical protein [Gossypium laxum]